MRSFFIFFCTTLFTFPLFAQFHLTGKIVDENQEGIPFGNVLLLSETEEFIKGAVADEDGRFIIDKIETGNYLLSITAIGFLDLSLEININTDKNLGVLSLEKNTVGLEEVTVTAEKVPYVRKADRTIVNVASLPTAAGGNALELLEKSPTVNLDRVNGNISLLGREGVQIYINGKLSRLGGNDLMLYLSSIPASNIESLELINNPPASYDAEGTGGVINIVLKEYEADGFNGSANVFTGYGQRAKYGGGLMFNYKKGKLNLYGDLSSNHNYTYQNSMINFSILFDEGLMTNAQDSYRPAFEGNHNAKLGVAYDLSDKTTVNVFGSVARRRWEMMGFESKTIYGGEIAPYASDVLVGSETNTTNQYNASTQIQHQINEGQSITADYDYLYFKMINPTSYHLSSFDTADNPLAESEFSTNKESPFEFHIGKLDYKNQVNKQINLEVGLKYTQSEVRNLINFNNENRDSSLEKLLSEQMSLTEEIKAAYVSVSGKVNENYDFIAGLRFEDYQLDLTTKDTILQRQNARLFPTLSITRSFSEFTNLTLSYRERITRPGFQNLAPSFFFMNPYTILAGNLNMRPNVNRIAELTFSHQSFFATISYSRDEDPIGFALPALNQEANIMLIVSDNLEDRQDIGMNVSFPIKFNKIWSSRYTFGGNFRRDVIKVEDSTFIAKNPFLSIQASQTFSLAKDWNIELSGRWNSKFYAGTLYAPSRASMNLGIQKKLKNGTLGIAWSDIFDSGSFFQIFNELPNLGVEYDWLYEFEGSIVKLSYSYNFGGKQKNKSRNSGATEILQRMN